MATEMERSGLQKKVIRFIFYYTYVIFFITNKLIVLYVL